MAAGCPYKPRLRDPISTVWTLDPLIIWRSATSVMCHLPTSVPTDCNLADGCNLFRKIILYKIIENGAIRPITYYFLLVFHCNCMYVSRVVFPNLVTCLNAF